MTNKHGPGRLVRPRPVKSFPAGEPPAASLHPPPPQWRFTRSGCPHPSASQRPSRCSAGCTASWRPSWCSPRNSVCPPPPDGTGAHRRMFSHLFFSRSCVLCDSLVLLFTVNMGLVCFSVCWFRFFLWIRFRPAPPPRQRARCSRSRCRSTTASESVPGTRTPPRSRRAARPGPPPWTARPATARPAPRGPGWSQS